MIENSLCKPENYSYAFIFRLSTQGNQVELTYNPVISIG